MDRFDDKEVGYVPLGQKPYCCVPASILTVMQRHGMAMVPQEELGHDLGLVVPREATVHFSNVRTGDIPISGYGTQIGLPEYEPNAAFLKLGIPLEMTVRLISRFQSLDAVRDYLEDMKNKDADILVCYGTPGGGGHVCVFDSISVDRHLIRLADPGINTGSMRIVRDKELFSAMRRHGDEKYGGFWELRAT